MTFGYIPALSFLGLIFLLLIGLLGMYYCLTRDLCPCTQAEADKTGYEELQVGEDTDEERARTPLPPKKIIPSNVSDEVHSVDGSVKPLSAYGDVQTDTGDFSDAEVGSFTTIDQGGGSVGGTPLLLGKVKLAAEYFPDVGRVGFSIAEAQNIPSKGKGGGTQVRFHVVLLPGKKQRFKTKSHRTPNPKFRETFVFDRLVKEDLYRLAVRLRLYGQSGVSKEKLIGEVNLQMADIAQASGYRLECWRDIVRPKPPGTMPP